MQTWKSRTSVRSLSSLMCASVFLCVILEINLSMPCWRMSQFLKFVKKREEAGLQKLKWRMHRCTELFLPSVYKRGEAHNWNIQIAEEGVHKLIVFITCFSYLWWSNLLAFTVTVIKKGRYTLSCCKLKESINIKDHHEDCNTGDYKVLQCCK